MTATTSLPAAGDDLTRGLYRTTIAGAGRSLADAFAGLERSQRVDRVLHHPRRDILSARVRLAPHEGEGFWELARIRSESYVILGDFQYHTARFEMVPGDGLVQFNFKISGDLNYGAHGLGRLRFNRASLHVWRQPLGIDMHEWTAPRARERVVSISVRPEFLAENFLPPTGELPARLKPFVSPAGPHIDFCQLALTAQMLQLTTQLLENSYDGLLYLVKVESLTSQLLCAAIESFLSLPEKPTEEYSDREVAALSAAHQYLTRQFAPAPTIRTLARAVGLGEKALMRGFKAVYGETIAEFGLRCRMQRALTLLRDNHWTVDRVSEAVGYSHPTSFTAAFRRHFRMRPIDAKRRG